MRNDVLGLDHAELMNKVINFNYIHSITTDFQLFIKIAGIEVRILHSIQSEILCYTVMRIYHFALSN